jgi:hypothetical protein
MAATIQRDIREYHIRLPGIAASAAGTAYVQIPTAGDLVKVSGVMTTVSDADQTWTFEVNGTAIQQNGGDFTFTMLDADIVGDTNAQELSPNATTHLNECETGDALATSGSVIAVVNGAEGTGGIIDMILTIRP